MPPPITTTRAWSKVPPLITPGPGYGSAPDGPGAALQSRASRDDRPDGGPVPAAPRDQKDGVVDRGELEREMARIIDAVEAAGAPLRVLGSIGVALHCPDSSALIPTFERTYADIDFAAYGRDVRAVTAAIAALGYRED